MTGRPVRDSYRELRDGPGSRTGNLGTFLPGTEGHNCRDLRDRSTGNLGIGVPGPGGHFARTSPSHVNRFRSATLHNLSKQQKVLNSLP